MGILSCIPTDLPFWMTALGNLGAGYNLAIVGHMIHFIEQSGNPIDETEESMVATAGLLGTMTGQIAFGYLAMKIGLQRGLFTCFGIVALGALLSSLAIWNEGILVKLSLCRFVTGVGIGGIFPISAILASDSGHGRKTSRVIHSFAFQIWGQLCSSVTALSCSFVFPETPSFSWRVCGFFGMIPSVVAFAVVIYARHRPGAFHQIHQRETTIVMNDSDTTVSNQDLQSSENEIAMDSVSLDPNPRWSKGNLFKLFGTGGSWFLFDMVYYGNVIFEPFVLDAVFGGKQGDYVLELSCFIGIVALPGVYLASALVDVWGAKSIQMFGFASLLMFFSIIAILLRINDGNSLSFVLFLLYAMTFFFYNFGPNATTFVLPSQVFDSEHGPFFAGISAASGKVGAMVGSAIFKAILDGFGVFSVMASCIVVCFLALIFTKLFVLKGSTEEGEKTIAMVAIHHEGDEE